MSNTAPTEHEALAALENLTPALAMVEATGSTNGKPRLGLGGAKEVIALVEMALASSSAVPEGTVEALREAAKMLRLVNDDEGERIGLRHFLPDELEGFAIMLTDARAALTRATTS